MTAVPARRAGASADRSAVDDRRLEAAETRFRAALTRNPRDAVAHRHLGCTLAEGGRYDEAIASFMAAAALAPSDSETWDVLAQALAAVERFGESAAAAERACGLAPASAATLTRFVEYALRAARPERAVEFMRALSGRHPGESAPALALAELLRRLDRHEDAVIAARACAGRWPALGQARASLGQSLLLVGDAAGASAQLRHAARLMPRDPALQVVLGNALRASGDLAGAEEAYARATVLDRLLAVAHFNRGLVRDERGNPAGALESYDRAITLDAGYAEARLNRAMVRLRAGRPAEAWDDYRWRETRVRAPVATPWPASLAGRGIWLRGEQGLGDQLFFLRFAALAAARGARLSFDGDARLDTILARAGLATGRRADADEAWIGDLPWLLQVDAATTFAPPLRLVADPPRVAAMRAWLAALPRPWLAVTWRAGGSDGRRDTIKEVPLDRLGAALAGRPGAIVSVQRGARPGEIDALAAAAGREVADLGACNDDLEEALAAMDAVDGYVAVSNTNFHLRCGLGHRSRILVPHPADWRFVAGADSALPWYPGQASYRQAADGEWGAALAALASDLDAEFGR